MAIDFLIFALPRTGSSSLMDIVNLNQTINCIYEPFNIDKKYYKFEEEIYTEYQLEKAFNLLKEQYNGIKHVWNIDGWPFLKNPALNGSILKKKQKVIFLRRKNILQRIISCEISWQTNLWDKEDKAKIYKHNFKSLDSNKIKSVLHNETLYLENWKTYMEGNGINFQEIYYEDLFGSDKSISEKLETIKSIYSFLGCHDANLHCKELSMLMDDSNKISSTLLYMSIPGIIEIENSIGSNQTGWLFK